VTDGLLLHAGRTIEQPITLGDLSFDLLRPANADDLISEADFVADDRLPYWADLWPSSQILATQMLADPAPTSTSRAIELGCGLGLVTIAALRAGWSVLATDYYEDAMAFTRENVRRALGDPGLARLTTRHADWRAMPPSAALGAFDRVVGADILYEPHYASLIADAIAHTLAPGGAARIADPGRLAVDAFCEALPQFGLRIDARPVFPFDEPPIHQRITIFSIAHDTAPPTADAV
jgi:predicted nicotinamide N-methyase